LIILLLLDMFDWCLIVICDRFEDDDSKSMPFLILFLSLEIILLFFVVNIFLVPSMSPLVENCDHRNYHTEKVNLQVEK
jgi:hypothetical protein